jgi:hypothetical protein
MRQILLLLTQMVFFWEINVILQLSWKGLFGTNIAYLHLENPKWQVVFLSKSNSVLTWKQFGRCSWFWH